MKGKVKYYECLNCGFKTIPDTKGKFVSCDCKQLAFTGTNFSMKVIGNKKHLKVVKEEKSTEIFIYRVKRKSDGSYYNSRGEFNNCGRFYQRVPSMKWPSLKYAGECEIEKYRIEKVL